MFFVAVLIGDEEEVQGNGALSDGAGGHSQLGFLELNAVTSRMARNVQFSAVGLSMLACMHVCMIGLTPA